MFDLEPGPLERFRDDALRPFPQRPSFEGLVAAALQPQRGVDDGLSAQQRAAGDGGTPDLDAAYAATVVISAETLANQTGAEFDGRAAQFVDTTAGAEAYRQTALPHLPQPSAPIEGDYVDPPRPPGVPQEGGGGPREEGI